jgi:hypothetical protein
MFISIVFIGLVAGQSVFVVDETQEKDHPRPYHQHQSHSSQHWETLMREMREYCKALPTVKKSGSLDYLFKCQSL